MLNRSLLKRCRSAHPALLREEDEGGGVPGPGSLSPGQRGVTPYGRSLEGT